MKNLTQKKDVLDLSDSQRQRGEEEMGDLEARYCTSGDSVIRIVTLNVMFEIL